MTDNSQTPAPAADGPISEDDFNSFVEKFTAFAEQPASRKLPEALRGIVPDVPVKITASDIDALRALVQMPPASNNDA